MIRNTIIVLATVLSALELGSCYQLKREYSKYALFRVLPQSSDHIEQLQLLMNQVDVELDFWTQPNRVNNSVDIMVSPDDKKSLYQRLTDLGVPTRQVIHDIGARIKRTKERSSRFVLTDDCIEIGTDSNNSQVLRSLSFYSAFQRYSIIESKLQEFAKNSGVKMELAGYSHENRKIHLVKVSTDFSAKKPVIFVDAGHHAREWISHTTLLYLMEVLINGGPQRAWPRSEIEGEDSSSRKIFLRSQIADRFKSLLNRYDFWFIPMVNPDGYEFTHKADRLWRKTRSRSGGFCAGVDPNRNYPFHWRESGASSYACHETYAGPKPLSEKEVQAVVNALKTESKRKVMYISLHCYSQLLLTPYGYDAMYPKNYADMARVAKAGADAIYKVRGTFYTYGPSSIIIYKAAGGSDDYAHGELGIRYSYTIELPDSGRNGFLTPPSEILPIGQETAVGIAAMIEAIE